MEYFYQNYSDGDDEFPYDHTQFYTDQVFNSREELTNWAQTTGRSLGYVIVTKRSKENVKGYVYRVLLKCDRGGVYKGTGSSTKKSSGTKKINCPFRLEGRFKECVGWRVSVIDHRHNHEAAEFLEGHSFARRLSDAEKNMLDQLTQQNLTPRDILENMKQQFPGNVSTIKDVYNARARLKEKAAEQVGSTPMQVILSLLHVNSYIFDFTTKGVSTDLEILFCVYQMQVLLSLLYANNYVYEFTTDGVSLRLENLFFVHRNSLEMWHAFPHVLIIDATYKTNIYNMPFVEMVGVTSTSKTFCIACVFMQNEKEVTYTWALHCLKTTLGECMHPRVIVTDRELSLMNACREVFPDAARLLCRYHIRQNIFKHCRPKLPAERDWGSFLHRWSVLIQSRTDKAYENNEFQLQSSLKGFPGSFWV